jgi:hypothetical protein
MKKSFTISSLTALAAFCLCMTAQAQGPLVVSDKDDYAPGETAMFQAAGFQPNELLDFSVAIQDENGGWVPDIAWADVPADASGGAEVDYVVPQTWADKTLQLTVMGLSSGLVATTTFTDSVTSVTVTHVNGVAVTSLPVVITSLPAMLTVTFDYETSISGATTADLDLLTAPSAISNTGVSIPAGTHTGQTISVTIPSGTTNQTANVKVTVHNSDGGGANNKNDVVNQAVTIAVPTPTPTTTATPTATPNSTPVITCASAASPTPTPVPLGQIVGCLTNNVLGTSVDVTYSVSQTGPKDFDIIATFSSAGNPTMTFATVHDEDGNLQAANIGLNPSTETLMFTGPGFNTQAFSTTITAMDDLGASAMESCGGNATAQVIYGNLTFLPPLDGQRNTKVKRGSGVPVKFTLMDGCGNFITTGEHHIDVVYASGSAPNGDPTVDDAGASAGDPGDTFRYSTDDMLWIFNLKTNNSYYIGNSYWINANLDDGTTRQVQISIK